MPGTGGSGREHAMGQPTPFDWGITSDPDLTWDEADAQARWEAGCEAAAEAEAWGGRGPSATYAEWAAEGRREAGQLEAEFPEVTPWM